MVICVNYFQDEEHTTRYVTRKRDEIASMLELLKGAEKFQHHKCGICGYIRFELGNGNWSGVNILPGHDKQYYEFRLGLNECYRVDRTRFFDLLKRIGVPREQIPPGVADEP